MPTPTMTTEEWLALCEQHRVYAHFSKGRRFVALGTYFGFGPTLPDAISAWCDDVERRYPGGLVALGFPEAEALLPDVPPQEAP